MKWPKTLTFIRHGESSYNVLKPIKRSKDSDFVKFEKRFWEEYEEALDEDWVSDELLALARKAREELRGTFSKGDYDTPLTEVGREQARKTGEKLLEVTDMPDVIYVSPYLRTRDTLKEMISAEPRLADVRVIYEERIREQEHGLAGIYNDWKIYLTFNPEQAILHKTGTRYEYRYLNGENKADVRDRIRSFLVTLIREESDRNVLVISHHLTLLSLRANLERWEREKFMEVDKTDAPINCGVTMYEGDASQGQDGRLILKEYNRKLY